MRNVTKTINTLSNLQCFDIFVRNLANHYRTYSKDKLCKLARTSKVSIGGYFLFSGTSQGYKYWNVIRNNAFQEVVLTLLINKPNPIIKKFNTIQETIHG